MSRRQSGTAQLERLREAERTERAAARDLTAKAQAARAQVDEERAAMVEAYANGEDIKAAEKRRAQAQADAEALAIQAEASGLRIKRAEAERQQYESANAERLIGELETEAAAVVARLDQAARELVEADGEWSSVLAKVGTLLAAHPAGNPRVDSRDGHRLAAGVREVRNALRSGAVESPMPHWQGRRAHEADQQAARRVRQADEPSAA